MREEERRLVALSEATEYALNERMPDVRGWAVETSEGETVGRVRELIVDRAAGRARYLEVELSPEFAGHEARRILVPVGLAEVDPDEDVVRVLTVTAGTVSGLEAYSGGVLTREYEVRLRRSVLGALEAEPAEGGRDRFYEHEHFDERRLLAGRRSGGEEEGGTDFSYLLGVGGAMTSEDVNPEIVGELGAGEMHVPVVREERRRPAPPG